MPVRALPDIPPTDETFLAQWARRACALESAGAYAWMASQIFGTHRVFEVGCGSGEGTLALLQAGKRVIAVEADEAALDACMRRLATSGQTAVRAKSLAEGASAQCDAVLVSGDFLALAPGVTTSVWADAIVCWNMGASQERLATHFGMAPDALPPHAPDRYRMHVQRACYVLANRILVPGSFVHVVDTDAVSDTHAGHSVRESTEFQRALAGNLVWIDPVRTLVRTFDAPAPKAGLLEGPQVPWAAGAVVSTVGIVA